MWSPAPMRRSGQALVATLQGDMANEDLTIRVRDALRRAAASKAPSASGGRGGSPLSTLRQALSGREAATRDLVSEGVIADVSVSPSGVARVTLATDSLAPDAAAAIATAAQAAVEAVSGVSRAVIVGGPASASRTMPRTGGHDDPLGLANAKKARIDAGADALAETGKVIAVASGKGGVGKSTVALHLALALKARGRRVGLLDADIYGPSLPTLVGWRAGDKPSTSGGAIEPVEAFGLRTMSIGYLVDAQKALAWRGPMVMGATRQLLQDVAWGPLDALIIDTPPGTGDVHLTLARAKRGARPLLDGAIVVTTPQPLAEADVARGLQFFDATGVPVIGLVRNMSFMNGADGARTFPFGEARPPAPGGAPLIGELPIDPALGALGMGPIDHEALPAPIKDQFQRLADAVWAASGGR